MVTNKLKDLIIKALQKDNYSLFEATKAVNEAKIKINEKFINVTYSNGISDIFRLTECVKLELIN